jgi:hypothetical protein
LPHHLHSNQWLHPISRLSGFLPHLLQHARVDREAEGDVGGGEGVAPLSAADMPLNRWGAISSDMFPATSCRSRAAPTASSTKSIEVCRRSLR